MQFSWGLLWIRSKSTPSLLKASRARSTYRIKVRIWLRHNIRGKTWSKPWSWMKNCWGWVKNKVKSWDSKLNGLNWVYIWLSSNQSLWYFNSFIYFLPNLNRFLKGNYVRSDECWILILRQLTYKESGWFSLVRIPADRPNLSLQPKIAE